MTTPNKGLIFKKAPVGWPNPDTDLAVETRQIDLTSPPAGGIIVKNHYVSFDPYQRGRMRSPEKQSYSPPFTLNEPINNRGIATVVASDHATWKKGDALVVDGTGTEEYSSLSKQFTETRMIRKLDNPLHLDPKVFIGALGMPGLTAYSSLYEIGQPKKGETIFISAASGAVGALVGQLAKREGLRVVGSVGDDEKLKYIKEELGFDDGFNYKTEKIADALKRIAPEGIDIYYENVGGEQLEEAIAHMKPFGRIGKFGIFAFDVGEFR
jgi:NADPH-dependent curcumin reductase CurA